MSGIIETKPSGTGQRGKTTVISLARVPASDLEEKLRRALMQRGRVEILKILADIGELNISEIVRHA